MFDSQGRHQVCSVKSVWGGRHSCLRFGADKSGTSNKRSTQGPQFPFFSLPVFGLIIDVLRQARNLKPLARLTARQQGARYIQLPRMRLVVVHEKYWLVILHRDKLIEFRSSKQLLLLEAGQCLLFARAVRHRTNGKDALVFARV
jgi:hypothetical protein